VSFGVELTAWSIRFQEERGVREPMLKRVSSYDELWSQIDHKTLELPEQFNLGVACVDDHDPAARALTVVAADRTARDYTFGDVKEQANRLGNALAELGIGRGDVVAVVNPASFETGVAYTGVWRMGAVALPLSSLFGPDALAYRLSNSDTKAVITSAANAPKVREALAGRPVPLLVIDGPLEAGEQSFWDALAAASADLTPVVTQAEDPAFLIYTSGTTGNPKGALHAHRIVFGQVPAFEMLYDFYPQPEDVLYSPADWAWIAGLMDILVPAWFYGLPVIVDSQTVFEPERAVWLMREFRVTLTLLPATALRMIRSADLPGGGFAYRSVCSGGEALGADLLAWSEGFFGAPVNEAYGQTELNGICGNCASIFPVRPGSLGRALPGSVVVILDDDGNPVIGKSGEIAVGRHHALTMIEYYNNPDGTRDQIPRRLAAQRRPRDHGRGRLRLVRVPQGRRHQLRRLPDRPRGDRGLPRRSPCRLARRRHRRAGRAARPGAEGVRRPAQWGGAVRGPFRRASGPRTQAARAARGAPADRLRRRRAAHHDREDHEAGAARRVTTRRRAWRSARCWPAPGPIPRSVVAHHRDASPMATGCSY